MCRVLFIILPSDLRIKRWIVKVNWYLIIAVIEIVILIHLNSGRIESLILYIFVLFKQFHKIISFLIKWSFILYSIWWESARLSTCNFSQSVFFINSAAYTLFLLESVFLVNTLMQIFLLINQLNLLIRIITILFLQYLKPLKIIEEIIFQLKYLLIWVSCLKLFSSLNRSFEWNLHLVMKRQNIDSDTVNIFLLKNRHWACNILLH